MHLSSTTDKIRLSVIFLQYDRKKYSLAFEKLVGLISELGSLDFKIVVVDNANPGLWQHEISDHIMQIGGDNSAWEFSAFDRGIEYLAAEGHSADIYAFVTDAFLAYGDDYLELIDEATLRYCLRLRSPVGWVDSFMQDLTACGYSYRDWMRTSFFFLPAELLVKITPLATPLDPGVIFGPTAESPFLGSAPLNANLREHLLAWLTREKTNFTLNEVWHSQLELTGNSFDFFKAKVLAILREHLLSARLLSLGIPCYDFRLVSKLAESNVDPSAIPEITKRKWQWLAGKDAEVEKRPRFYIEDYTAPRAIAHGNHSELKLKGWVITDPQINEVVVRLSGGYEVGAACDLPRPDVIANLPEYRNELCGFDLSADLDCLAPGTYEVEWSVPAFGLAEKLGTIDVLPRSLFRAQRCFVPDSAFPGQEIPVAVEGVLEASFPLRSVDVLWNGEKTGLTADFLELRRRSNGLYLYTIKVLGDVRFPGAALQHRLEIEFNCARGDSPRTADQGDAGAGRTSHVASATPYTWRHFQAVAVEETRPHTLSAREIGELDPKSGSVPIYVQGGVFASSGDDRLVLMWEGRPVFEEKLSTLANVSGPIAWFEIQREITGVPAGTWEFSLAIRDQAGPPEAFARWRELVKSQTPTIHVEHLKARLPEKKPSHYFLGICGWVEYHHLVDRLLLKLDGKLVATLGTNRFREDVAAHFGEVLVRKQGFQADVVLNAPPGDHVVELVAVQENGADVVWEGPLTLGARSTDGFMLSSPDLDELENSDTCSYWSAIAVSGEVYSELKGVVAVLEIDGGVVRRQEVSGRFLLSHAPETPGRYQARVYFQHEERILYDSGANDVTFTKVEIPTAVHSAIGRFVKRFQVQDCLDLDGPEDLAHALLQLEREGLPEFLDMLREIDVSLKREKKGAALVSPARRDAGRPLKVLFACWEVPSSRHGGGVWMTNLLKQFHGRHEVTLVHAYGPEEEGWVDEVRPFVVKTVSVPRAHQPAFYRGDSRIPSAYYDDYTPALRAAIEAEVFGGDYDIVNHEYTKMYSHISQADIAQVLIVHENILTARINSLLRAPQSGLDAAAMLLELLKNFYFLAGALPQACEDIIALTGEDVAILSDFQRRARIYVNTIGVETDFAVPKKAPKKFRRGHPTVVFLGNYRHPPNVEAAVYFVENVMPGLRKKVPDLEFLIIGSHPSEELKELDSTPGVSVTGFVDDYRPYLFAADAFVAPIFTGAGMRVKILEAMACGIPIVGTGLSMNGIGAIECEHYYRADSASEFVAAVKRCLKRPKEARSVGRKGRKLIVERHSYQRSARDREAIWHNAIGHWQRARAKKPAAGRRKLALVRGTKDRR